MYNRYAKQPCSYSPVGSEKKPPHPGGGILSALSSFLPAGIDTGDILLLLILLFLFLESEDEDFLIILAVVAFKMFSGK